VISREPSYHGVTFGGMALTGLPLNRKDLGPGVGDVIQVPKDDLESVSRLLTKNPGKVAAVFAEPVIGAGANPTGPGAARAAGCAEPLRPQLAVQLRA